MKKQTKLIATLVVLMTIATLFVAAKKQAVVKKTSKQMPTALNVVNFEECIYKSKLGQDGQKSLQTIEQEFTKAIDPTQKEWETIDKQLNNTEYVDGIAPKKEKELSDRKNMLEQTLEMQSYQFNQMYNQARTQMWMVNRTLANQASENIAKAKKIPYVIDSSAFLYYEKESDLTKEVIKEMDKIYEKEKKDKIPALPAPETKKEDKYKGKDKDKKRGVETPQQVEESNIYIQPNTNTTEPATDDANSVTPPGNQQAPIPPTGISQ